MTLTCGYTADFNPKSRLQLKVDSCDTLNLTLTGDPMSA
jgi:hypothetical protein